MDSVTIGSSTEAFIDAFQTLISDNIGLVLTFAAGILAWVVLKKWVFGGAGRV